MYPWYEGKCWVPGMVPKSFSRTSSSSRFQSATSLQAASGENGMSVSPLINSDRKGGALPIMLQQFRRAIGVCIVRGQAKLKLSRLHYVRETVAEAADICKQNHSENRWNPNQNGSSSWFSENCPMGYGTFEQFRNGYDFCVP